MSSRTLFLRSRKATRWWDDPEAMGRYRKLRKKRSKQARKSRKKNFPRRR